MNGVSDRPAGFVGGNVFDKYRTAHPLYRRLTDRFLSSAAGLLQDIGSTRILEVGAGPGDLACELGMRRAWGTGTSYIGHDVSLEDVVAAATEVAPGPFRPQFLGASAYRLPFADRAFDCVIACEVLEHLEHPELALDEISRVAGDALLVSVPWEPVWRLLNLARGRYLRDLGNTPGHLQHFSRTAIRRLIATRFRVVAERNPFPWTMLLARRLGSECR